MRLSRAAEYAVRCMLYLSVAGKGILVNRRIVAREMDIPAQFLGKIAQQLARAGLVEIIQGAKGGFRLTVLPAELTLLMVIEAVIGEIFLNDCILRPESCDRSPSCKVHVVWEKVRSQLRESLQKVTFATLITETPALVLDSHSGKPHSHNP
jgi:Rrf2 family protein